ncbi:MAG: Flp pilus assembly complex ATPase component TadA [Alphaproteobacteria bacterium]|nr:Flp pilus assembly complex ATPase component TadA [Alphaproteobacteria bacterium]
MFDKLLAKLEGTKPQPAPMPRPQRTVLPDANPPGAQTQPVKPEPIHTPDGDLPPVPAGIVPPTAQPEPAPALDTSPQLSPEMVEAMNHAKPPMSPEARMAANSTMGQATPVHMAPQPATTSVEINTSNVAPQQPASNMAASTASAPPSPQAPVQPMQQPVVTSAAQNPMTQQAPVQQPQAPTAAPIGTATVQTGPTLAPIKGATLHTTDFADIWYTPENIAYVRDVTTSFALRPIETGDLEDFKRVLEQSFQGISSYAVQFGGDTYRVERVKTSDGIQYNCRKMPTECPEIESLGFAPAVVKHLTSLSRAAGLLLFAGPTGQGKTTTVSALMKRYLNTDGGFLYTIEDPPEMPLRGLYRAENGGLGLCKQTPVENDQWGAGLRSALRSKPRYILVGEIRTPETASQCLVAATSGHLVLSTIHASGVEDALNSMIKYAASTGLDNSLVSDLLARGILGVVHQRLEGTTQLKLVYQYAFANPNPNSADQMRMTIRDGNINLATYMEQQHTKMDRGLPLFRD